MAEVKMTKNELRSQQTRLNQLERYLPTLQLKKALLQAEITETKYELQKLTEEMLAKKKKVEEYSILFTQKVAIDWEQFTKVKTILRHYDNIAGIDIPYFDGVTFPDLTYDLFDTPVWIEGAISGIRDVGKTQAEIVVVKEKKAALEEEFRSISIRVNLFEKILIPRCLNFIKKIKVFLGDQQLAAVSQAKVAKGKIIMKASLKEAENKE